MFNRVKVCIANENKSVFSNQATGPKAASVCVYSEKNKSNMLVKMILGMLLKACIPLAIVLGGASYFMYMKGGDPGAIFSKVAGGVFKQAKESARTAGSNIESLSPIGEPAKSHDVYKWVDEYGVTHFSAAPPDVETVVKVRVNPNRNVVAPTKVEPLDKYDAEVAAKMQATLDELPDEKMPGAAGMDLPFEMDEKTLKSLMENLDLSQ